MAKKESTLFNMVSTLLVITAVSSASLGFMFGLTKEPKMAAEKAKQNFAIMSVLPKFENVSALDAFDNNPLDDEFKIASFDGGDSLVCYPAFRTGDLAGIAVKTWTKSGFSGLIRLMVGFDKTGNIINISVLEHKETPGLGTKMADDEFKDQYKNRNPGTYNIKVKKDGGKIDAITAATITAQAFSDAVLRAYNSLEKAGKFENN